LNLSTAVDSDEELCRSPDDPLLEDEGYICMQGGGNPPKWFHETAADLLISALLAITVYQTKSQLQSEHRLNTV